MLTVRRIAAAPLFLIGGAIWVATVVAAIVASCWYTYVGLKMVFEDGLIVEGALVATFVPMVAIGLISLLAIPGHALLAASGWLRSWTLGGAHSPAADDR